MWFNFQGLLVSLDWLAFMDTRNQWKYHVFLSFRGEDTRKSFTDHLFTTLKQKGVFTFRDDKKLEKGKPISPELSKAIEGSLFVYLSFDSAISKQFNGWHDHFKNYSFVEIIAFTYRMRIYWMVTLLNCLSYL